MQIELTEKEVNVIRILVNYGLDWSIDYDEIIVLNKIFIKLNK